MPVNRRGQLNIPVRIVGNANSIQLTVDSAAGAKNLRVLASCRADGTNTVLTGGSCCRVVAYYGEGHPGDLLDSVGGGGTAFEREPDGNGPLLLDVTVPVSIWAYPVPLPIGMRLSPGQKVTVEMNCVDSGAGNVGYVGTLCLLGDPLDDVPLAHT